MRRFEDLEGYLEDVSRGLRQALGSNLQAIVLTGSAVIGDFDLSVSDVDLMVVVDGPVRAARAADLAANISHDAIPCPAVGLDLAVFRRETLRAPATPVPYELGLETGARWGTRLHPAGAEAELLLDLAIAREHGLGLQGIVPAVSIAPVSASRILASMRSTLRWHQAAIHDAFHDPTGAQAVLNACRALYYCDRRCFVSKSQAATWAAFEGWDIGVRALSARIELRGKIPRALVVRFLELAAEEVEARLHTGGRQDPAMTLRRASRGLRGK